MAGAIGPPARSKVAGFMAQDEIDALRAHIRQLNHAVATTTSRKTVDVLRQMLSETEAKLGDLTDPDIGSDGEARLSPPGLKPL